MVVEALSHDRLLAELPQIEKMTPAERIQLARQRREIQLAANMERERMMPPARPRNPRLRFSPEVALLEATGRGDLAEVEKLLREGASPDSHNEDGLTPLHQCAIDDNPAIVRLLLDYGADVNAKDTELWTPLHAAACCGYATIVQLLINANADLVAVNADGNMPYDLADDEATLDIIETRMANIGITQEYINECRSQPENLMLNDMKQKHQRNEPLNYRYPLDGSTYLHCAAANGYHSVAAFLLRCGVEVSARDNDLWQPIHAAASWNQPELLEILCEYGAEINATTALGETPMDLASDPQTKQTIATLQQNEARKRRLAFGVRDSRRQSRKRKKFESPGQVSSVPENPFSARGAIRRLSLRDRSGMTLARIEAQKEQSTLMRSWSKEDVATHDLDNVSNFQSGPQRAASLNEASRNTRDSPNKRVLNKTSNKSRTNAGEEWVRQLENRNDFEEEEEFQNGGTGGLAKATRGRSSTKKKKKRPDQIVAEMNEIGAPTSATALNGKVGSTHIMYSTSPISSRGVEKKGCCCTIM
ncbi:hypothetical protein M3Y97_00426700 [Aphelenchoides bicaudatus]|nr:hypothetical protein M3Y97_00426700 [Aphelenchoides bicaudatus]